jgi:hypothetical protein
MASDDRPDAGLMSLNPLFMKSVRRHGGMLVELVVAHVVGCCGAPGTHLRLGVSPGNCPTVTAASRCFCRPLPTFVMAPRPSRSWTRCYPPSVRRGACLLLITTPLDIARLCTGTTILTTAILEAGRISLDNGSRGVHIRYDGSESCEPTALQLT